ncbi:MAG: hypothetical protein M9924_21330 [Rhizobiaceae bacterium]|nr:hypothetical protein [Rhizobiaceae bacterium]
MASPQYFLRIPQHQADELEALADRLETSPGLILKVLVDRTISETATVLHDHDLQLEHVHLTIRDIAKVFRDLMSDNVVPADDHAIRILEKLDDIARAVDSIRDAAFVRPSTSVRELIAAHDEAPVQQSFTTR